MRSRIDFRFDATNQIVIATPHWHLQTEADVQAWFVQYETYFKRFRRKMDFIVVLDDFEVATAIGALWGDHRARLLARYTRLNFRVRSTKNVRLFVNTSGVRHSVSTVETATVEEAIEAILATRRREGLGVEAPPPIGVVRS